MNLETNINGKEIFDWITRKFPPLTWSVMAVKIGDHFLNNGVDPFNLNDQEEFNKPLIKAINNFLLNNYNEQLPDFNRDN